NFLFAFNYKGHVAGQGSIGFQISFARFEMREVLAFVVTGAPPKDLTMLDARFERFRFPKLEGLRRLHVVMTVENEMRAIRPALFARAPHHNRIACGAMQLGL